MAMGEVKGQAQTLQVEMVCLDELVPADDRFRKLDLLVDWGFVRELAAPYYADELGRPSIDPIVLVKLMVAGALEGSGSMRELVRQASLRLDLRRFLGYGFSERLPVHQTISHAHTRRFVDGQLFERLFSRSVALCLEHGLIEGTHLSVDGFHAEADAALASLRASLRPAPSAPPAPAESAAAGARPSLSALPEPPQLQLALPRTGRTPRRRSSNATAVSRSDPEARLRGKPGQRPHLVYRAQVAVDAQARFACPELASLGTDQGYAANRVWEALEKRGITAFVPPQRTMLPPDGQPQTEGQRRAQEARRRCKSARGIWAHKRRMADAEGANAELKNRHGLDRARCRGRSRFHVQLLLGCSALNMKRLATRVGDVAEGQAAVSPAGPARTLRVASAASTRQHGMHWRSVTLPSASGHRDQLISVPLWSLSVSLN